MHHPNDMLALERSNAFPAHRSALPHAVGSDCIGRCAIRHDSSLDKLVRDITEHRNAFRVFWDPDVTPRQQHIQPISLCARL